MLTRLKFRLLGPLLIFDGTGWVAVRAPQQRILLAALLSEPGRVLPTDRIIEEIWGQHPPKAATAVVRGYVMRLRQLLGDGRNGSLSTRPGGYELATGHDRTDEAVFEELVTAGRRALVNGETGVAMTQLSQALDLWRGPALADVPATPAVTAYTVRLEQARLSALEDCLGLKLDHGRPGDVVDELEHLAQRNPLRERLWEHLMVALDRCGRRGEALEAYHRARRALVEGLGLEPGQRLRDLQHSILSGPGLSASPPHNGYRIVPAQLPADPRGFTGRRGYLERLDALMTLTEPALILLTGTGGVGKTALAVHWAHRIRQQFTDGQLYVNLRGFDPSGCPMGQSEAIRYFLDAFQVPHEAIPAGTQAQAGLYRSVLSGKRMLIVLDNARDAEQVRPLLPGASGCLVIVTSRNDLRGLVAAEAAHPVFVDLMSASDARDLLVHRIGVDRVAGYHQHLDEIVTTCGGLPLALAIVAARAAARPAFGVDVLAAELRQSDGGFESFAVDDIVTDPLTVFSWSYRVLESEVASLFRLLGLHPGPEVGVGAAASLLGLPEGRARNLLMRLAHANLATEVAPGRFALHDLLRSYARQLVQAHDDSPWRDAARRRMVDHYLFTGYTAAILLDPLRDPIPIPVTLPAEGTTIDRLADHRDALRWFRQEHPVLLRVVEHAAMSGMDRSTGQLAWCLSCYLDLQGHMADLAATQRTAYHAAARIEETCLQAVAGRLLARALANLGEYDEGRSLLREILDLGTPVDRAHTNAALCQVEQSKGDHRTALLHARSALDLFRANDHPMGQARALNLIGWSQLHVGDAGEAVKNCRQALRLLDRAGDRIVEGNTWDTLGLASHHLGKPGTAIECYERALAIHQDLGNRLYEAETLLHIAHSCDTLGERQRAEKARRDAMEILQPR